MGVEGGDGDVDDFKFSDGAVADVGRDENGGHGADGDEFAVEFHVALAFEDEIDLGQRFVVMGFGIDGDVHEVDRGGLVFWEGKSATGGAAGALGGFDFIEVGDDGFLHFVFGGIHGLNLWKREGEEKKFRD